MRAARSSGRVPGSPTPSTAIRRNRRGAAAAAASTACAAGGEAHRVNLGMVPDRGQDRRGRADLGRVLSRVRAVPGQVHPDHLAPLAGEDVAAQPVARQPCSNDDARPCTRSTG